MLMQEVNTMDNVFVIMIMEVKDKFKTKNVQLLVMLCLNKCVEELGEILCTKLLQIKLNNHLLKDILDVLLIHQTYIIKYLQDK